ncbi:MAG: metallophosphoesterase [Hyphomonadaceae bacterium]
MTLRFVHVSDLHFGQEDQSALHAAADYIAATRPDAVLVSGDLTAAGGRRQMRAAFTWLRGLRAPVVATPGNHDTPQLNLYSRLADPFARFARASHGVRTDLWMNEAFAVVPVNTARGAQWRRNWALGAVSRRQLHAALDALQAAPRPALKIVMTHHPLAWPQNAPIQGETRGGPAALDAMVAGGASVFVCGHLHRSDVETVSHGGRLAAVVCAGTLSRRHRGEPGAFVAIRAEGAMLEIERLYASAGKALSAGITRLDLGVADGTNQRQETLHLP